MSEIVLQMLKAQAWEEAKGKLRALSAIEGHRRILMSTPQNVDLAANKWRKLNILIEEFIERLEDDGLQE